MKGMNLEGQVFGRLTVESYSHSNNGKFWVCQCECGNKAVVSTSHLRAQGEKQGCGCMAKEAAAKTGKKYGPERKIHGMNKTKLKTCYDNMIKRCYTKTAHRYERYGGRGIKVCDEWRNSRARFYQWAITSGYRDGLSIERDDVDGDYCPENCRWVPVEQQQANTSRNIFFEIDGEKLHLAEICRRRNVKYSIVFKRIKRGWPIIEALNMDLGRVKK